MATIQLFDTPASAFAPAEEHFYGQRDAALDSFGRRINYLRISLTDRCNFRCVYCMPEHGAHFAPRDELLHDDELLRVVGAAAAVGFEKIRLTGGEPTIRRNLVELIRGIKQTSGIREISMTTNALKLAPIADALKEAGLSRVNISIDSLQPDRFRSMTRGGDLARVWAGIDAAERVGWTPLKLNAVVVRGLNDDEVVDLARLTVDRPWQLRFIEMMPLAGVGDLADASVVSSSEIMARLEQEFGPLEFIGWKGSDPARTYRLAGAQGELGFISSVTEPFCATCNRMRLTADGKLHLCLLRDDELDLREALRNGAADEDLEALIRQAVFLKPWGHGLPDGIKPTLRGMSELGG
ncbi:MAG: GTP 3',8-cyclase MoaA [Herpetosiphonaceae bacterium]|nr:GTP 3',8-cyclase MoaA [Herpetosiphonaceae bacterium]